MPARLPRIGACPRGRRATATRRPVDGKLDGYLAARDDMLRGRTEAQFLETVRRVGPYLTVTAGIALERAHQAWVDETIASLNARRGRSRSARR